MKRNLLAILMIALFAFSCGNDDEEEGVGGSNGLIGTWTVIASGTTGCDDPSWNYSDSESCTEDNCLQMIFTSNQLTLKSTYNGTVYNDVVSYSTSGNTIIIDGERGSYSISDNTLTYTGPADDQGCRYTLTAVKGGGDGSGNGNGSGGDPAIIGTWEEFRSINSGCVDDTYNYDWQCPASECATLVITSTNWKYIADTYEDSFAYSISGDKIVAGGVEVASYSISNNVLSITFLQENGPEGCSYTEMFNMEGDSGGDNGGDGSGDAVGLVGTWIYTQDEASGCNNSDDNYVYSWTCDSSECIKFIFTETEVLVEYTVDGQVTTEQLGNYTTSGNDIIIDGEATEFALSGNTLELSYDDPDNGCKYTLRFVKE